MFEAARVTDITDHLGVLAPVGHPDVEIEGLASCTMGDQHKCPRHPPCNPIVTGSPTVEIGGLAAARKADSCQCMASISGPCARDVIIGGGSASYSLLRQQNCYGYASQSPTFRQPGGGIDYPFDANVRSVREKLEADLGPAMADPSASAPAGMHKIVFYTYPDFDPSNPTGDWDFHVWRQDSDGYWSHKPGGTPIKRFDNSCQPITDPSTADRGGYSEYVGTWLVPNQ